MKKLAPILIIVAASLWGIIGVFIRRLSDAGFNSLEIVAIRAVTTTILMMIYISIYNKSLIKIQIKDLWMFLGTGIISIVLFNACYFKTIDITSLSVASVFLYTAPFFVMIISIFLFNEKITKYKIIALILAFTGCILVTGIGKSNEFSLSGLGILTGLGAGIGYAFYSIFTIYALKKYHPFTITLYTFFIASITCIILFFRKDSMMIFFENKNSIWISFLLGLISTVLPYILYTTGLKYVEASKASIMAYAEPYVATLVGIVVYDEPFTLQNAGGMILILISIIILNYRGLLKGNNKIKTD